MQSSFNLKIEPFNSNTEVKHFACVNNQGGLKLENTDPDAQKGFMDMVKKLTGKVLSGVSVMELILPANMLYKGSNGELICQDFALLTAYATAASKVTDPIERISILTAGFVGGMTTMSRVLNGAPPIPMRIGETYQAVFEDGSRLYLEQAGPKRTDTLVLIIGPNESFRISTHFHIKLGMKGINPNSMKGHKDKPVYIFFKDGQNYSLNFPK